MIFKYIHWRLEFQIHSFISTYLESFSAFSFFTGFEIHSSRHTSGRKAKKQHEIQIKSFHSSPPHCTAGIQERCMCALKWLMGMRSFFAALWTSYTHVFTFIDEHAKPETFQSVYLAAKIARLFVLPIEIECGAFEAAIRSYNVFTGLRTT